MSIESRILESKHRADRSLAVARTKAAALPATIADAPVMHAGTGSTRANNQYNHLFGHAYTAIAAIAKRIAGQRVHVASDRTGPRGFKATIGDECEPLDRHAFYESFECPNPLMTSWSLVWSTVASLNATGRAYWFFADDPAGGYQIWPIPSHWIEPADPFRSTWKIRFFNNSEPIPVPGEFIAPFILPDPSDPLGSISPLQTQASAIDADEALQQSQASAFSNGGRPGMVITAGKLPPTPGQSQGERPHLTAEQRTQLINAIRKAYSGAVNHGEPIIVDGMIEKVEPYTASPHEMDWLQSGKQLRQRIFSAFGVNPLIVGEIEGANRAQAVVAEKSFCNNVINPLLMLMSQVLTRWAAPLFSAPDEKLRIWFEEASADDREMRLKEWQIGLKNGAVDAEEYRRNVLNLSGPAASSPAAKMIAKRMNPYTLRALEPSTNGKH